MPDVTLNLEVSDVDGRPIIDPTVVVRLARSDGSSAAAWRVAFRGQRESLSLNGAPAGFALILRLTPSRYHDLQVVSRVQDGQVRPASGDERLIAPRRSSEWNPSFTPWAALPAAFDDFRRVLDASPQFRLGRTSNPEPFFGVNYDAVDPADESRVLAKLSLLNLYSRVSVEVAPATGQPWFARVQELLLATRERFIAEVDETCLATVHQLAAKAQGGYHRAKHELHIANFEEMPGGRAIALLPPERIRFGDVACQPALGCNRVLRRQIPVDPEQPGLRRKRRVPVGETRVNGLEPIGELRVERGDRRPYRRR